MGSGSCATFPRSQHRCRGVGEAASERCQGLAVREKHRTWKPHLDPVRSRDTVRIRRVTAGQPFTCRVSSHYPDEPSCLQDSLRPGASVVKNLGRQIRALLCGSGTAWSARGREVGRAVLELDVEGRDRARPALRRDGLVAAHSDDHKRTEQALDFFDTLLASYTPTTPTGA